MFRQNLYLFSLLLGMLWLGGCATKNANLHTVDNNALTRNPAFAAYVEAYTGGSIQRNQAIYITLTHPLADSSLFGLEAGGDLINLKPSVEGKLTWEGANLLKFQPESFWPSNTSIEASLNLKKLYPNIQEKDLEKFDFGFRTITQTLQFAVEEMLTPDAPNGKMSGKIHFSDYVASAVVEESFVFLLAGKKQELQWYHSEDGLKHKFSIKSLALANQPQELKIEVEEGKLGLVSEADQVIQVPARNSFQLWYYETESEPEALIRLSFTQPIDNEGIRGAAFYSYFEDYGFVVGGGGDPVPFDNYLVDGEKLIFYPTYNKPLDSLYVGIIKNTEGITLSSEHEEGVVRLINLQFATNKPSIKILNNGFIAPPEDGKMLVRFKTSGLKTIRVDVVALGPEYVADFFNSLESNAYDNTAYDEVTDRRFSMISIDKFKRYGEAVFSKLISVVPTNESGSTENKEYQTLNLTELSEKYPNHVFKVWLREEEAIEPQNGIQQPTYVTTQKRFDDQERPYAFFSRWYEAIAEFFQPSGVYTDVYFLNADPYTFGPFNRYQDEGAENQTYLISTHIGLAAKVFNGQQIGIHVTDLNSGEPLNGAEIQLMDRLNRQVEKGFSDQNGFVIFQPKKAPVYAIATHKGATSMLPFKGAYAIDISNFTTSGGLTNYGDVIQALLYSERDLYRPGDSIYATLLVQEPEALAKQAKPVVLRLLNDRNATLARSIVAEGVNGFYTFKLGVPENAETGRYSLQADYAGASFYRELIINYQSPNRMNISTRFGSEPLVLGKENSIKVSAKYLFGAAAANAKVKVIATASGGDFYVDDQQSEFKKFQFTPVISGASGVDDFTLLEATANELGYVEQTINLKDPKLKNAQIQRLELETQVAENSGEVSVNTTTVRLYTQPYYMGLYAVLNPKAKHTRTVDISVVLLEPETQKKANVRPNLKGRLLKEKDNAWYDAQNDSEAQYNAEKFLEKLSDFPLIYNEKTKTYSHSLTLPDDDFYRWKFIVSDPDSKQEVIAHLSYEEQNSISSQEDSKNPAVIVLDVPKRPLKIGDTTTLKIPTHAGEWLNVIVENNFGILEQSWLPAKEGLTAFTLKTKESWSPNVFVNVRAFRPYAMGNTLRPVRRFGLANLEVKNPNMLLEPVIKVPNTVRAFQDMNVKVSENSGKEFTYTLAVVDEGLLNLTRYQTPDAYQHFDSPAPYRISNFDMYADVITGEGIGKIKNELLAGGDEYLSAEAALKSLRFKPVVRFLGPFKLKKGATNQHNVSIPNYYGQVRIMVIAAHHEEKQAERLNAYGSADAYVTVKQDIMASIYAPKIVGPQERIMLPLTMFVENKNLKKASIKVLNSENLSLDKNFKTEVSFKGLGEYVELLPVLVGSKSLSLGTLKLQITADNGTIAYAEVKIPIGQANLLQVQTERISLAAGAELNKTIRPIGAYGQLQVNLFSTIDFNWLQAYADAREFPTGSAEDAASLGLQKLLLLEYKPIKNQGQEEQNYRQQIEPIGNYLGSFQLANGLYHNYSGEKTPSLWASLLAHFFNYKASEQGSFYVYYDEKLKESRALQNMIQKYGKPADQDLRQIYTGLLILCHGIGEREMGNKFLESKALTKTAFALQLIINNKYQGFEDKTFAKFRGEKNIKSGLTSLPEAKGFNPFIARAIEAMALVNINSLEEATLTLQPLAEMYNSYPYLPAEEKVYLLLAAAMYQKKMGTAKPMAYQINLGKGAELVRTLDLAKVHKVNLAGKPVNLSLKNLNETKNNSLPLRGEIKITGIPNAGEEKPSSDGIAVQMKINGAPVAKTLSLSCGTLYELEIETSNTLQSSESMQVSTEVLLPSGFETLSNLPLPNNVSLVNKGNRLIYNSTLAGGASAKIRIPITPRFMGSIRLPSVVATAFKGRTYGAVSSPVILNVVSPSVPLP